MRIGSGKGFWKSRTGIAPFELPRKEFAIAFFKVVNFLLLSRAPKIAVDTQAPIRHTLNSFANQKMLVWDLSGE